MCTKVCGHLTLTQMGLLNIPSQNHGAGHVFVATVLLGRLYSRFWNVAVEISAHLPTRALVIWGMMKFGVQLAFWFILKLFSGADVSALCRSVISSNFNHDKPCLCKACFVYCHAGTCLGPSVAVKGNCIIKLCNDILYNCVLPNLWS